MEERRYGLFAEYPYIKMCTLPSPKLDLRDLQAEKKLLEKEEEFEE